MVAVVVTSKDDDPIPLPRNVSDVRSWQNPNNVSTDVSGRTKFDVLCDNMQASR